MNSNVYLVFAIALLVKNNYAQFIGIGNNAGTLANGLALGTGLGLQNNVLTSLGQTSTSLNGAPGLNSVSNGGAFAVTSSSQNAPIGLSVFAENLRIEGPLAVEGRLPLMGSVTLDGQVPTTGTAGVSYGCGDGNIGIQSVAGGGQSSGLSYGSGQVGGLGYGTGQVSGLGYGNGQVGGLGYGNGQVSGLGYGNGQVSGLGYGNGQVSGLGYGTSQVSGLGYGTGQISGLGYGAGLNRVY